MNKPATGLPKKSRVQSTRLMSVHYSKRLKRSRANHLRHSFQTVRRTFMRRITASLGQRGWEDEPNIYAGDFNNNKMERMNGEIRDRERCMRTLERSDTPILSGMRIYHNFVKPHQALGGKTPAEAAGIEVNGENKWITIIQNASKIQKAPK